MNAKLKHIQDWPNLARQAKWSVAGLARLCNVTRRTLERYFHETLNQSPKAWLRDQRHRQAIELLCDGSSVKETAATLAYLHASTFSREFKKVHGQSPLALSKSQMPMRNGPPEPIQTIRPAL